MKAIAVSVTNNEVKGFLRDFFTHRKIYKVKNLKVDERTIPTIKSCDVLILDNPCLLDRYNSSISDECQILAIIPPKDVKSGLKCVVKHNIESYLLPPYNKEDLDYKLRSISVRKRLFENLFNEKRDLEAIAELTYLLSSTLNPREVLYLIVKKVSEIIDVTRCSVLSIGTGERNTATVVSSHDDPKVSDIKIDLRKYPEVRRAFRTKDIVVIEDAMKDPLMKPVRKLIEPIGIKSIVVAPVIHRDEVIGTIFLRTSRSGHTFTDREIRLCGVIAKAASNALYNAFLYEKVVSEKTRLEKFAITDFLTGIYNIRYFYHRLEDEFSRALRYNIPLSCIMFDLDYFKKINDTYGHRVGDVVLREFAQLVRRHTRKSDVFTRYGGEEFILLLPQTTLQGAISEAKRLSNIIKEHSFRGKEGLTLKLTASMGVSACPHKKIKTYDDLITYADNALFQAKQTGRNKLSVFR